MLNSERTNDGQIYDRATQNYNGIVAKGAGIPVTMVDAPGFLAKRDAFKNTGVAYGNARKALSDAYDLSEPAQTALYDWLVVSHSVLVVQLGRRWSTAWSAAGYPGPTRRSSHGRGAHLTWGDAQEYYTQNPGAQVASMNVTADTADDLTATAVVTQQAVLTAEENLKNAGTARDIARTDILGAMSTLVANLNKKLAKDDPRWLAFGLRMPATRTTPTKPTGLRATVMGMQVLLECDTMEYATRYRFRTRIVGMETQYKLAASAVAPMVMLEGIAAGLTLEVIVQAVNGSAQSVASDPILVTMPATAAAAKPEAVSDAETAPLPPSSLTAMATATAMAVAMARAAMPQVA